MNGADFSMPTRAQRINASAGDGMLFGDDELAVVKVKDFGFVRADRFQVALRGEDGSDGLDIVEPQLGDPVDRGRRQPGHPHVQGVLLNVAADVGLDNGIDMNSGAWFSQ